MEIKKKYGEIKYDMPDYEALNKEFEISTIEAEEFLLREIRRKMYDKIDKYLKILDSILQPEALIADMQECHTFTDEEKKQIYAQYKKLMYIKRLSYEIALDEDDETTAKFINDSYDVWQEVKPGLKKFVSKLKECWKKESDIHEVLNYMG